MNKSSRLHIIQNRKTREKQHRHKLAVVAERPHRVMKTNDTTAVIEKDDKSTEKISKSRVVTAAAPEMVEEIQALVRPITEAEMNKHRYPERVGNERESL